MVKRRRSRSTSITNPHLRREYASDTLYVMTSMKRALVALLAVALVAAAVPVAWPPTRAGAAVAASRVDPTLLKAVVRVFVKTSKRSYVGTGFIVSRAPEG